MRGSRGFLLFITLACTLKHGLGVTANQQPAPAAVLETSSPGPASATVTHRRPLFVVDSTQDTGSNSLGSTLAPVWSTEVLCGVVLVAICLLALLLYCLLQGWHGHTTGAPTIPAPLQQQQQLQLPLQPPHPPPPPPPQHPQQPPSPRHRKKKDDDPIKRAKRDQQVQDATSALNKALSPSHLDLSPLKMTLTSCTKVHAHMDRALLQRAKDRIVALERDAQELMLAAILPEQAVQSGSHASKLGKAKPKNQHASALKTSKRGPSCHPTSKQPTDLGSHLNAKVATPPSAPPATTHQPRGRPMTTGPPPKQPTAPPATTRTAQHTTKLHRHTGSRHTTAPTPNPPTASAPSPSPQHNTRAGDMPLPSLPASSASKPGRSAGHAAESPAVQHLQPPKSSTKSIGEHSYLHAAKQQPASPEPAMQRYQASKLPEKAAAAKQLAFSQPALAQAPPGAPVPATVLAEQPSMTRQVSAASPNTPNTFKFSVTAAVFTPLGSQTDSHASPADTPEAALAGDLPTAAAGAPVVTASPAGRAAASASSTMPTGRPVTTPVAAASAAARMPASPSTTPSASSLADTPAAVPSVAGRTPPSASSTRPAGRLSDTPAAAPAAIGRTPASAISSTPANRPAGTPAATSSAAESTPMSASTSTPIGRPAAMRSATPPSLTEEGRAFLAAVKAAQLRPYDDKPALDTWLAGPYRDRIQVLQRFALEPALQDADREFLIATLQELREVGCAARPDDVINLLIEIGVLESPTKASLQQQALMGFSVGCQAQVDQLFEEPPRDQDALLRRDLHTEAYMIDDASTNDVDDAISAERLPDGRVCIAVHVADVDRYIPYGSPLFDRACHHACTVYTPRGPTTMLPDAINELVGLGEGRPCCAISFSVCLDNTGSISSFNIQLTRLINARRLTYEQVDALLACGEAPDAIKLLSLAAKLHAARRQRQAIAIELPHYTVDVVEGPEEAITVTPVDAYSNARSMVGETMIMAGIVAGQYGKKNELELPYSSQVIKKLPPGELERRKALPAGIRRALQLKQAMAAATLSNVPRLHAALGLDVYVRVTSPIRRHPDLMAHVQLKAAMRGDAQGPLDGQLAKLLPVIDARARDRDALAARSNSH